MQNTNWELSNLGDLVDYKKGYAFKSIDYRSEGIRVIRVSDTTYNSIRDEDPIYLSSETKDVYKEYELLDGDIIVTTVGSRPPLYDSMVGKVITVPRSIEGSLLNQNAVRLRAKSNVDQLFLYNNLTTRRYVYHIESSARGNANQASITLEDLFAFEIPIPPPEEQQKIASILSIWDKAIELKEKLIEQKKERKKGLMQKLLMGQIRWNDREKYTEGEIQERLEMIKGGEVPVGYKDTKVGILPEEWMVAKLKKISKRMLRKNEGKEEYPVLTISSLSGFLNQSDRFSKVIAGENLSKYILIKKNEFAYNKGNSKTYPCGCIFRLEDYDEAVIPNVYYSFQIIEGDTEFYKHYFISGKLNRHLTRVINTGVRNDGLLNLDVNDFFDIPVACPPKNEQRKIAEVLSLAVEEIQCLEREVDSLKKQKKGLMQLLLTGKVRVKV